MGLKAEDFVFKNYENENLENKKMNNDVIPAKAGISNKECTVHEKDPRFRGDDVLAGMTYLRG